MYIMNYFYFKGSPYLPYFRYPRLPNSRILYIIDLLPKESYTIQKSTIVAVGLFTLYYVAKPEEESIEHR
jgi:hypothetical protein